MADRRIPQRRRFLNPGPGVERLNIFAAQSTNDPHPIFPGAIIIEESPNAALARAGEITERLTGKENGFYRHMPMRSLIFSITGIKEDVNKWYEREIVTFAAIGGGLSATWEDAQKKLKSDPGEPSTNQMIAEYAWEEAFRPYYCIHPALVSQLCRVNFEKIPSTAIAMPHLCNVVAIRLAEENPLLSIEKGRYFLRTMLVWRRTMKQDVKVGKATFRQANESITFWIDFGERISGMPLYTFKNFPIREGQTIAEAFPYFATDDTFNEGVKVPMEFVENAVKLFLSVGFLSQCDKFPFVPDVLAKDRCKYRFSNDAKQKFYRDRAHRKGKVGWFVGTDNMFKRLQANAAQRSEGAGRELGWAHIRGGHLHFYWCGPRDNPHLEPRWIKPTTVRPDLPFKQK